MSGLPPVIDTAQPGTPANEWAKSTTTAALARTEPAPAFSTTNDNTSVPSTHPTSQNVSVSTAGDAQKGPFDANYMNMKPATPGSEIPGAYPATPGEQSSVPNIPISAEDVKVTAQAAAETAQSAASTAGTYLQSAATTAAQYLPQGVVDTVSSYIPGSTATATMSTARASEHDSEHTTSFPTREFSGASSGEHTGGVGSLPGPLNETGVTKLPHERVDEERYMTAGAAAAALAGGAYAAKDRVASALPSTQDAYAAKDTLQQKAQETAQAAKQAAPAIPGVTTTTHSTAVTASTVPTREPFGAHPGDHSSGAGALPGMQEEPHVARLPEESAHPQYDSGAVDTAAQVALKPSEERYGNERAAGEMRHVGGVGALVGSADESSVALAPDERAQTATSVTGQSRVLPSQEPLGNDAAGAPKHVGGVGALPGKFNESGAAILPDERAQTQGTGTGTVTEPKEDASAPAVPPKNEQRSNESPLKGTTGGHKGKPNQGPAYDTDYHPAELHPPTSAPADPHSEGEKSLGATQADANRPAEEQRPPHQSAPSAGSGASKDGAGKDGTGKDGTGKDGAKAKKAGFMDKMKGEAKVLLGKIEHKQEKVEAGQRLKAGEA